RDVGPLLPRLPRRHLPAALAPRFAPPRHGGGGLHRLRGGVVALRFQGLGALPDLEPDVRAAPGRTEPVTVPGGEQTACPGLRKLAIIPFCLARRPGRGPGPAGVGTWR